MNRAGMETQVEPLLALGVRGYACQVFSDAPVAWALHKETHLISWRDERSGLRVDRFDARNLLDDASAFRRLKREPRRAAAACDEPARDAEHEQELHRLRYGDYAVLYPVEELHEEDQEEAETTEAAQEATFEPSWPVPETIECLPRTAQAHEVVVATARKAAAHPQLEVMLRVKQRENPAFSFLTPSHELHGYYCFVRDYKPYEPRTEDTRPVPMAKPAVELLGEEYVEESDSDHEQQQQTERQRKQAMRLERAKRLAGHFQQTGGRKEKSPRPDLEPVDNTESLKKRKA